MDKRDIFRTLFESATEGLIVVNQEGIIQLINPRAEELFGYTHHELDGEQIEKLLPDRLRHGHHHHRNNYMEEPRRRTMGHGMELYGKKKDGSEFPVEVSLNHFGTGKNMLVLSMISDITERKNQQLLLEEAQRLAHIGSWEWDIEKEEVFWSDELYRILDYDKSATLPSFDTFLARVHEEDVKEIQSRLQATLQNDTPYIFDYRIKRKDGSIRYIHEDAKLERDPNGKPIRMLGSAQDITEQKLASEELKEQHHFIQKVAQTSPYLISIYDLEDQKVVFTNNRLQTFLGYTEKELAAFDGVNFLQILHPEDTTLVRKMRERIRLDQEDAVYEHECRLQHRDGHWVWLLNRDVVFSRDEAGNPLHYLSISADITQRKDAENAYMTAMLQGQEQERERVAKELHDSLGQILSAINLNLKTLEAELPEASENGSKDHLNNAFNLLENAIKEVRNISHGLLPGALEDLGLIKALEMLINSIAVSKLLEINFHHAKFTKRLPRAIEVGLYRITQELLNNIFKHARANEVNVQLIRHEQSVILMVEDDGIGFEGTMDEMQRNGIGLRNIAARVRALNGVLTIDSSKGIGTSVTIEIPTGK